MMQPVGREPSFEARDFVALDHCFPSPFSSNCPLLTSPTQSQCKVQPSTPSETHLATGNTTAVVKRAHQLHALVAISLCCEGVHTLLVTDLPAADHNSDTAAQISTVAARMMPAGPRYIDLVLTPETTRDEVCNFLYKSEGANSAAPTHARHSSNPTHLTANRPVRKGHVKTLSAVSSDEPSDGPQDAGEQAGRVGLPSSTSGSAGTSSGLQAPRTVVLLYGLHHASEGAVSALIDLLLHNQTLVHSVSSYALKSVRTVRVVAVVDNACLYTMPCRTAFTLSLFMPYSFFTTSFNYAARRVSQIVDYSSVAGSESAPISQDLLTQLMCDPSAIRNPTFLHFHTSSERYLRMLLGTLRGTLLPFGSVGAPVMGRMRKLQDVVSVAVTLFAASRVQAGAPNFPAAMAFRTTEEMVNAAVEGNPARVIVTPTDCACMLPYVSSHLLSFNMPEARWLNGTRSRMVSPNESLAALAPAGSRAMLELPGGPLKDDAPAPGAASPGLWDAVAASGSVPPNTASPLAGCTEQVDDSAAATFTQVWNAMLMALREKAPCPPG